MGTVNAQRGNAAVARERYEASLAIRERLGDEASVAALTNNLGIVAQQLGETAQARELRRARAARCTRASATGAGSAAARSTSPGWTAWQGDHESARRHCEEAIALALEVGDRLNLAIAQNNLGDALRDLGRLDEAGRGVRVGRRDLPATSTTGGR